MATLQIENLPDELYTYLQAFASDRALTLNEAAIYLLKQALQPRAIVKAPPQTDATAAALQRIRDRPKVNPTDFGLPDSTELIREDRNR